MTEAQSLKLDADECATLSPESGRFRSVYQQVQPRSAKEVRELLGLSPEATSAVHAAGICCHGGEVPAASAAPEELDSKDPMIRAAARQSTYAAFNAYVRGPNPEVYAYLVPTFNRYLDINKAVINIAWLTDIEVLDGATLTISASTQLVRANKIIIHRTGRIVCRGSTTFKIVSLEGIRPGLTTHVTATTALSASQRSRTQ